MLLRSRYATKKNKTIIGARNVSSFRSRRFSAAESTWRSAASTEGEVSTSSALCASRPIFFSSVVMVKQIKTAKTLL